MHPSQDTHIQIAQLLRFVLRRKGIILLAVVTTVCASWVAVSLIPPGYQSSATIMIRDRETLSRQVEDVMGGVQKTRVYGDEEKRVTQTAGRIRSFPFLERVVKTLRMTESPEIQGEARKAQKQNPGKSLDEIATRMLVERIRDRIDIRSRGAGIIEIMVSDPEPQTAQLLAKWISELFIDITTSKELEQIRSVRRFGDEQLRIYEQELKTAEDELEFYQRNLVENSLVNGIVGKENLITAENVHGQLLEEVRNSEVNIATLGRKATALGFSAPFSRILEDPDVAQLSADLTSAMDRQVQKQVTTGDAEVAESSVTALRNALYQGVHKRVREIYPEFSANVHDAVTSYAFTWFDVESRKKTASNLKRHINEFRRQVRDNPGNEIELTKLQDRVDEKRRLLESFRAQTVASDVSQAVEATSLGEKIEILDPAQVPLDPSSPNKKKILAMALIMGPILGLGLAFLIETMDPTLRSLADIQRVAPEAVLGVVPLLGAVPRRRGALRRHWVPVTMAVLILFTVTAYSLRTTVFNDWTLGDGAVLAVDPEASAGK